MQKVLKFTLIGDGSSDEALLTIIKWLLNDLYPNIPSEGKFADFRFLKSPPAKSNIQEQVNHANKYYPYDILFFHRDAESTDTDILDKRKKEVLGKIIYPEKVVCVVPIKMMEAWLLIDEMAVKKAAGNRNYKGPLNLPNIRKIEKLPDPKDTLHRLLVDASNLKGRKAKGFNPNAATHLVSENITDFSVLRQLTAFQQFETDLKIAIDRWLMMK